MALGLAALDAAAYLQSQLGQEKVQRVPNVSGFVKADFDEFRLLCVGEIHRDPVARELLDASFEIAVLLANQEIGVATDQSTGGLPWNIRGE